MPPQKRARPSSPQRHHALVEHDELVLQLTHSVSEKRLQVADAHRRLNDLSHQLAHLERQLAERLKHLTSQADAAFDWLQSCAWDSRLKHALANVFGIQSFRPLQHEALNATLMARDVFAILPTGAGKSLVYQLAAVVDGGLTLVVSPLISLSKDQQTALRNRNIRAECLHSELDKQEQKAIYASLLPLHAFGKTSKHPRKHKKRSEWTPDDVQPMVLFVTPEQVVRSKRLLSRLEKLHENGHLSRICVDEAHCCSSWGHDFRLDYRKLSILRRQCPSTPIVALTATCDSRTAEDVCSVLEMRDTVIFRGGVNRPNLFYEVRPKADSDADVITHISECINTEFKGQCGIIYVLSRKDAENYAEGLAQHAVSAACYHGDLHISFRTEVYNQWSSGKVKVVVATIAFGLGIDHPHVRFVIHATIASSLEAYYQESGRAGRDGLPAKCIVLHKSKDFARMSAFVGDKGPVRLQKMYEMYKYACSRGLGSGNLCRRELIVKSFGEELPPRSADQRRRCCDLCEAGLGLMPSKLQPALVTGIANDMLKMIQDFVDLYPDKKTTILQFANDWGKWTQKSGQHDSGSRKALSNAINVNTRVEIIIELIMTGALKEIHRHSSYAVNAYVTIGDDNAVSSLHRIEVALWKQNKAISFLSRAKVRKTERVETNTEPCQVVDSEVIMIEDSDEEQTIQIPDGKQQYTVVKNLRTTAKTETGEHDESLAHTNEVQQLTKGASLGTVEAKKLNEPRKKRSRTTLV